VREADNLTTFTCRMSKSGSLNLPEPSGPHRLCYGTPFTFKIRRSDFKAISQHFPGDAEENQDSRQNRQSGARRRNSARYKWVVNILGSEIMQKLQQRSPLMIYEHKEHEKRGENRR
jgi:hypothetical protein